MSSGFKLEMARVLVIGDPHFKVNDLKGAEAMSKDIVRIAKEELPDAIVDLGDTLDRFELAHTEALTMATEWLWELSTIAPVKLLIGNHDRVNNSDFLTGRHPFVALKYWGPRMSVVDHVIIEEINQMPFFFVPYVPPGRFQEALETHPDWSPEGYQGKKWTSGFSHQEFYGIEVAKGIFSDKGDRWPLDGPLIINGHIHDRNIPQKNIISIGTPRQHDFDESHDKAISLFTFNEDGTFTEKRIPLNIPKKINLTLSSKDFYDYQAPVGLTDYLKLIVVGNTSEINAIIGLKKVKDLKKQGIVVATRNTDKGKQRKPPTKVVPPKQWQTMGFRERVQLRIKDRPEMENIFKKILQTIAAKTGTRRLVIKRK